ncbi:MAG: 1-acyl-sn-glycerol-3-phosphate acyltransferase [Prevotella sp.]|nr:1-acyl-sn-glycerol-3-phosphate acyltransferase [Prevotella sp.]
MNDQLRAFDDIRPFEPEELPAVYERLLADKQFQTVVAYLYPDVPLEAIAMKMRACKTNLQFQREFCYTFLKQLLAKASKGCDMDCQAIDTRGRYTFVSNHRDIVLDSALLDVLLFDAGFTTTCEIAIGDNLLSLPWVKDLVRVNKSFIVERSLPPRQMLMASKRLSEYMHYAIGPKNENIWIAQREGRAKDSNDRTQPAILKMMAMGGQGSAVERLMQLHIVPLAISYEFDPCDYLKAAEFQLKRDVEGWKKSPQDDVLSMRTGIMGYKGRVHYQCAPCIDDYLTALSADIPKTEVFDVIASHIDEQIHRNYRLYPSNYVALDLLERSSGHSSMYTLEEKAAFEQYVEAQLAKIDIVNKDERFLRERMLTMYANPVRNFQESVQSV